MKGKCLLRWFLRRDVASANTRMGGWIAKVEPFFSIVIGVQYGIWIGLGVFILSWICRSFAGYLDLKYFHATSYTNDYLSAQAPQNVCVIKKRKFRK